MFYMETLIYISKCKKPMGKLERYDRLAIETHHHATTPVLCYIFFLNKVLSLAVSQPKNSVYSCIFPSWVILNRTL